jgi:hypothetical protein
MVTPAGIVHWYEVAVATAAIVYVRVSGGQIFVAPPLCVMAPGVAGAAPELPLTVLLAVAVQPLVPVTVTVYVPAAVTVRDALEELLFHKYVPPPLATKLMLAVEQEIFPDDGVTLAVGGVVLLVTVELAIAVQPFVPVTVTV